MDGKQPHQQREFPVDGLTGQRLLNPLGDPLAEVLFLQQLLEPGFVLLFDEITQEDGKDRHLPAQFLVPLICLRDAMRQNVSDDGAPIRTGPVCRIRRRRRNQSDPNVIDRPFEFVVVTRSAIGDVVQLQSELVGQIGQFVRQLDKVPLRLDVIEDEQHAGVRRTFLR